MIRATEVMFKAKEKAYRNFGVGLMEPSGPRNARPVPRTESKVQCETTRMFAVNA